MIFPAILDKKEKEIEELKTKIAEVLAVMPQPAGMGGSGGGGGAAAAAAAPPTSNASLSGFGAPTTLSLDLPAATDLSFTDKISSTLGGLAEQFSLGGASGGGGAAGAGASDDAGGAGSASAGASGGGLYSAFGFASSKANGKVNDA